MVDTHSRPALTPSIPGIPTPFLFVVSPGEYRRASLSHVISSPVCRCCDHPFPALGNPPPATLVRSFITSANFHPLSLPITFSNEASSHLLSHWSLDAALVASHRSLGRARHGRPIVLSLPFLHNASSGEQCFCLPRSDIHVPQLSGARLLPLCLCPPPSPGDLLSFLHSTTFSDEHLTHDAGPDRPMFSLSLCFPADPLYPPRPLVYPLPASS